ncbi:TPA: hypothetical protein ACH3X1_008174 [Trebouxia sp. C0004]
MHRLHVSYSHIVTLCTLVLKQDLPFLQAWLHVASMHLRTQGLHRPRACCLQQALGLFTHMIDCLHICHVLHCAAHWNVEHCLKGDICAAAGCLDTQRHFSLANSCCWVPFDKGW